MRYKFIIRLVKKQGKRKVFWYWNEKEREWFSSKKKASLVTGKRSVVYVRDWAKYGVEAVLYVAPCTCKEHAKTRLDSK